MERSFTVAEARMKDRRRRSAAIFLAAAFILTGCGSTLYELTPEEQTAIASYAAQAVAKHNLKQQDGEISLAQEDFAGEDSAAGMQTDSAGEASAEQGVTEEAAALQEGAEGQSSGSEGSGAGEAQSASTLTEALGLGQIQADYAGCELCDTYQDADYFAVDANAGNQFLAVKVNLTNQSDQDLHIDILSMKPSFQAVVNDSERAAAQTTILLNDLSTYQDDLAAGETKETVLLFQVSREISSVTSLRLEIAVNGSNFAVDFIK